MEYSTVAATIEDAEDLFLLAKERLLDVNAWHSLFNTPAKVTTLLIDGKNQRLHRDVHMNDNLKIQSADFDIQLHVSHIQYDDFPDIAGESLTMALEDLNAVDESKQVIVIKRIGKIVMVQSSSKTLIPAPEHFLTQLIATGVYEIAAF